MSLNFKAGNFYLVFFVIFIIIITNVFSDSIVNRFAAVSVVLDNKLYILGGLRDQFISTSLFYVDLINDFNAINVPWVNINDIPVRSSLSVGAVGGSNNSTIFLFGGVMENTVSQKPDFSNLLYAYDINTKAWNPPKTTGVTPINRRDSSIVVDGDGKMYIFGGIADELTGSSTVQYLNDMYILNTVNLTWHQILSNNPTSGVVLHTSTLLSDGRIVIIGGREGETNMVIMYNIKIFDTKSSIWSTMTASGPSSIQSRMAHSAVLSKDGKIIVYGGGNQDTTAFPELVVLDTTTSPFQWSVPNFSNVNRAPPLIMHTANLIGDQMIICFGNVTNNFTYPQVSSANTYILDIKDFSWKTSYSASLQTETSALPAPTSSEAYPSQTETPISSSPQNTIQTLVILSSILGTIVVIAIASFITVMLYQKKVPKIHNENQLQCRNSQSTPNTISYPNNNVGD